MMENLQESKLDFITSSVLPQTLKNVHTYVQPTALRHTEKAEINIHIQEAKIVT